MDKVAKVHLFRSSPILFSFTHGSPVGLIIVPQKHKNNVQIYIYRNFQVREILKWEDKRVKYEPSDLIHGWD
jgi:hypothetical protein